MGSSGSNCCGANHDKNTSMKLKRRMQNINHNNSTSMTSGRENLLKDNDNDSRKNGKNDGIKTNELSERDQVLAKYKDNPFKDRPVSVIHCRPGSYLERMLPFQ